MIAYFDTSAIVPLLVSEPSSELCRRIWRDADERISVRLAYVETAAALAAGERLQRLTDIDLDLALGNLQILWSHVTVVEIDQLLVKRAAVIARRNALRGYDAVHAAAAERVVDAEVVAVAGDRALLAAWQMLGLTTVDTNAS